MHLRETWIHVSLLLHWEVCLEDEVVTMAADKPITPPRPLEIIRVLFIGHFLSQDNSLCEHAIFDSQQPRSELAATAGLWQSWGS